ncbi:unnamed protein product [Candida verbasci]|uniref:Mannose-6-phosphate isomerase n=1 Tax=Candida verbasci TaxID=1227364 RepID=A0A9W4TVD7_9ASCO|nr:unnamed protein product [Candida verbasci]
MSLFRLNCGFQNYDWGKIGSSSAVAKFAQSSDPSLKIDESKPYAELWMGTHPKVPSKAPTMNNKTLKELTESNPEQYLGNDVISKFGNDLPFLFKVLSIEKVLSIQAHPDKSLGAQLHSKDPKNYPDDNHKPEMAIAVTPFEGFCGFKPLDQLSKTMKTIPELYEILGKDLVEEFVINVKPDAEIGSDEDKQNRYYLQKIFGKLMNTNEEEIAKYAESLVKQAETEPDSLSAIDSRLPELILRLNKQFPNDIGLFCGCLLLNHVHLNSGEAMFLQAKDPHAYISGDIIECMAASDNVVRAGFTPKFKDVDTLVDMLTYSYDSVEKQKMKPLEFERTSGNAIVKLFDPPIAEFSVLQTIFEKSGVQNYQGLNGPSIIIATDGSGSIEVKGEDKMELKTGYVYFVSPNVEIELSTDEKLTTYRAFVE